jgi:hypothetical protein
LLDQGFGFASALGGFFFEVFDELTLDRSGTAVFHHGYKVLTLAYEKFVLDESHYLEIWD